jgi:hypothetical protein
MAPGGGENRTALRDPAAWSFAPAARKDERPFGTLASRDVRVPDAFRYADGPSPENDVGMVVLASPAPEGVGALQLAAPEAVIEPGTNCLNFAGALQSLAFDRGFAEGLAGRSYTPRARRQRAASRLPGITRWGPLQLFLPI